MAGARDDSYAELGRRWPLVLAAASGVSLASVTSASLGVMIEPIERDLGWTRTQITLGPSLVPLIVMVLSTGGGLLIDRFGPRLVGLSAATAFCAGLASFSLIGDHLWQWWGLWALIGVASATMPTVWLTPVSMIFTKGKGLAVALVLSGSGISTTLVPILANAQVQESGWRSAYLLISAIWFAIVMTLLILFFRVGRAPKSQPTEGAAKSAQTSETLPGFTAREGFRQASFWKLGIGAFLSMSAGVALILNLVPVLRSTGLTPTTAASIAGLLGIATIVGRVFGGWLLDRFSAAAIASVSAAGCSLLPVLLLTMAGSVPVAAGAVAVYGLLGGAKVPAVAYLASRHFGQRAFGTLYGAINTSIAFGVGAGPLVANMVYDSTSSYEIVMLVAVPFMLVAAICYGLLGRYPDFDRAENGNSAAS
ncbi:hypothetical protein B2G71_05420 [Novosphingobium sp. PC22D]|uniref:MFS transporter n=1 Tax=Novosphingobium sp. PC22D TaxID=1962403 RepID=UPI000BF18CC0|nr:MFS transporter [Novosphingobium sp. PC22D]PEQ13755.1 hypothetical protein B2G71_05420 [Novosphingobium sp. PC22D]